MSINRSLVLISGDAAAGKSTSLRNLSNPKGVAFLNCESGKELPFPSKFKILNVINTQQVYDMFLEVEKHKDVHTIVIDSLTFLMDMYETTRVLPAEDGRAAWGEYAQYFKKLMQEYVSVSTKNVIMLGHSSSIHNELKGIMDTSVVVKGSLMKRGIEAYFCNVVSAKKLPTMDLMPYKNPHLIITPEEEALGFKYVFQTRLTKQTVHEKIRGPLGLWDIDETFIDNDAQFLLDHLHKYYN